MWSRCVGLLAAVAVVATAPAAASAKSSGVAVSLTIDDCVDVDGGEVRRLFGLELGTSVPDAVQSDRPDATRVEVRCDGELVVLRVEDPVTGKSLTRRIELAGKGRERLLALAVMELLVASWLELETTPEPAVPPADTHAAPATREHAREIVSRRLPPPPPAPGWRTTTSLLGGVSLASPGVHPGGGIRVVFDAPNGFGWSADVMAHRTTDDLELGTVEVTSIDGSLSAHAHARWAGVRVRAAAGARLGAVTLSGDPAADNVVGASVTGLAGGPFVRVGGGLELASQLALSLSVESGFHLFPVRGTVDGNERTSVDGVWVAADLAVGWVW